jgi:hypothetical protein
MYLNSDQKKKLQLQDWLISATLPEINHLQGFARIQTANADGVDDAPTSWLVYPGLCCRVGVIRVSTRQEHAAVAQLRLAHEMPWLV